MDHIEFINKNIEGMLKELKEISNFIHNNPELGNKEYKAQDILTSYLKENGFEVEKGLYNLDTSFKAVYDTHKPGKTICFMAEYDALAGLGHACGHNIIGTSSLGGGVMLKKLIKEYKVGGKVIVLGTPDEEVGSGKIKMIKEGAFKGVDHAILMHPTNASVPDDISFASVNIEYTFLGKSAHAAAFPWIGKSALNSVIQMFNSVNAMRLHLKDYSRVHGIITNGGQSYNSIPDKASCIFNIRSLEIADLEKLIVLMRNCAKGAAISTATELRETQLTNIIKNIKNDTKIVSLVRNNMIKFDEEFVERNLEQGIGSTDVGNVTHEISAIQYYIRLDKDIATHTKEFEQASGDERGYRCLEQAIKVNAATGFDLLTK